jgi:hypothetical protein
MSSGFVSGGTIDAPIERSDEWLAAQQELEANRRRKAEAAQQAGGRSLYETLEANKGMHFLLHRLLAFSIIFASNSRNCRRTSFLVSWLIT